MGLVFILLLFFFPFSSCLFFFTGCCGCASSRVFLLLLLFKWCWIERREREREGLYGPLCVCVWVSECGCVVWSSTKICPAQPGHRTTYNLRPTVGRWHFLSYSKTTTKIVFFFWLAKPPVEFSSWLSFDLSPHSLIVVVFFSLYTQLLCECCSIGKGLCCCCCKCFRHDLFVSIPCASSSLSFSLSIWPANRERQISFKSNSAHSCATSFSLCIRSQTLFFFFYVRLVALFLYNNKTKWLFVFFFVCVCVSSM